MRYINTITKKKKMYFISGYLETSEVLLNYPYLMGWAL